MDADKQRLRMGLEMAHQKLKAQYEQKLSQERERVERLRRAVDLLLTDWLTLSYEDEATQGANVRIAERLIQRLGLLDQDLESLEPPETQSNECDPGGPRPPNPFATPGRSSVDAKQEELEGYLRFSRAVESVLIALQQTPREGLGQRLHADGGDRNLDLDRVRNTPAAAVYSICTALYRFLDESAERGTAQGAAPSSLPHTFVQKCLTAVAALAAAPPLGSGPRLSPAAFVPCINRLTALVAADARPELTPWRDLAAQALIDLSDALPAFALALLHCSSAQLQHGIARMIDGGGSVQGCEDGAHGLDLYWPLTLQEQALQGLSRRVQLEGTVDAEGLEWAALPLLASHAQLQAHVQAPTTRGIDPLASALSVESSAPEAMVTRKLQRNWTRLAACLQLLAAGPVDGGAGAMGRVGSGLGVGVPFVDLDRGSGPTAGPEPAPGQDPKVDRGPSGPAAVPVSAGGTVAEVQQARKATRNVCRKLCKGLKDQLQSTGVGRMATKAAAPPGPGPGRP